MVLEHSEALGAPVAPSKGSPVSQPGVTHRDPPGLSAYTDTFNLQ